MRLVRLILFAPLLVVTACAPSPLFVAKRMGTGGEIPRDGRGEPMWDMIKSPPPSPPVVPFPSGS